MPTLTAETPGTGPSPTAGPGRAARARDAALHYGSGGILAGACAVVIAQALGMPWLAAPAILAIGAEAYRQYRIRRVEIERNHAIQAQLSIYRVAEIMVRADREEELIRHALEAIAEGTGIPHWAMYAYRGERREFGLVATRGLPRSAEAELFPDPPGPEARSPASRAAWQCETQVASGRDALPDWRFPAGVPGLGPAPVVLSIPVPDQERLPAVLQCFLPSGTDLDSERRALLRWMAAQLSSGLKRLRLERRDQLLASYMLSTGEILFGLDLEGRITHANAAAESALGVSAGSLIGTSLDRMSVVEGDGAGRAFFELARSNGEYSGEIWFLRGDGTRFPAEVRLSPAFDRNGTLSAMVLVGRDVTERRDHVRELRSRAEELSSLNGKLQSVNRELENAQRLQNEFLANTSHELRTPLNAVIGFSTLLEQGVFESETERQDFARSIREAAEHLLGVINDLLDLAKVAAGRFQLNLVLGDLRQTIQAAADAVAPLAAKKGLNLAVDTPEEPLDTALDPARMRQVLLNVLGNAVKFTDRGEVRIRAWRDPGTEEARVTVEDTGVGIARERQARLFTKFGQADSSYNRRHKGTGLGLAISRALVEKMGGRIGLESEGMNRGTRVTLAFPAPMGSLTPRME